MHPGLITIEAQIASMAERWGGFKTVERTGEMAIWEGMLRPTKSWYRLRVAYRVPRAPENFTLIAIQPRVQVIDPILERHSDYEEGPVPHVYTNKKEPWLPFLCLFDPFKGEWTPADLLAETTIPWATRYLYFYEGWLLTGKWKGGGRHPTIEERLGDGRSKAIAAV